MIEKSWGRFKPLLWWGAYILSSVFLFGFCAAQAQINSSYGMGLPQIQMGNEGACIDMNRNQYSGEMKRNFDALQSNRIDARTFAGLMKNFDLRSYEDFKRCMEGKSMGPMPPIIPPPAGSADPGPDWWNRFKPVPTPPPIIYSQPLPQPTPPPLKANAILAVDGIALPSEILGKDFGTGTPFAVTASGDNYIRGSLQSFLKTRGLSTSIDPMPWSGATSDTARAVALLKIYITARGKSTRSGTFTVVAHSWGGVLAYAALQELQIAQPEISVNTLVTMGSPVGMLPQLTKPACFDTKTKSEGILSAMRNALFLKPEMVAGTATRMAICTTAYLDKYRGRPILVPSNIRHWINWYADGDGISIWIVAARSDGRQGVENRKADDSKQIGGDSLAGYLPTRYIANNHSQYFAWNYAGNAMDGQNIRDNATRVLTELATK